MISLICSCFMAYLVGSIPTGKLIAGYKGIDIQSVGTGNIGASNTYFILGKKYALFVLFGDLGKAYVIIYSAFLLDYSMAECLFIGLFLLLGNSKSIFLDFKGGKGIATSLGIFLATEPYVALVLLSFWLFALIQAKFMEITGVAGLISVPLTYYRLEYDLMTIIFAFIMCIIILMNHKSNFVLKNRSEQQNYDLK